MSNGYYSNKRIATIKTVVAIILVLALLAGIIGAIVALTKNNQGDELQIAEQENNYKAGAFVTESTVNGAALMVSAFSADSLSVGESVAQGSTASVSVTYSPSYLTNVEFDYELAFENPSSVWASGKSVSDYMTFTPSSDGATTGTLTCKKAFGEPIILTATSRDENSVSGSCTLGYIARPTIDSVYFCPSDFGDAGEIEVGYTLGDGTHKGTFSATGYIALDSNFVNDVEEQLDFDIQTRGCSFTTLNVYDDEYFYIQYNGGAELTWDLLISNFNSLSSSQKEQLYYTWFQTWWNSYRNDNNILLDYNIKYSYNGDVIFSEAESDLPEGYLNGDVDGSSIELDNVNVNNGGTILF